MLLPAWIPDPLTPIQKVLKVFIIPYWLNDTIFKSGNYADLLNYAFIKEKLSVDDTNDLMYINDGDFKLHSKETLKKMLDNGKTSSSGFTFDYENAPPLRTVASDGDGTNYIDYITKLLLNVGTFSLSNQWNIPEPDYNKIMFPFYANYDKIKTRITARLLLNNKPLEDGQPVITESAMSSLPLSPVDIESIIQNKDITQYISFVFLNDTIIVILKKGVVDALGVTEFRYLTLRKYIEYIYMTNNVPNVLLLSEFIKML